MMKISTKPMSSPSRTEKFPPLMRFLRSNVGSRSRGRSRSSPMFVRKKNAVIETTQEPSSPKVTCIGQVRVRRSSKHSGDRRSRTPDGGRCSCWWVQNRKTLFFRRPRLFRPVWQKWVRFFRFGCCRGAGVREESSKKEPNRKDKYRESAIEGENDEDDDDKEEEASQVKKVVSPETFINSSQPPKNALLLTRSRSAPYRSSSLAIQFWSSAAETEEGSGENREPERPTSENDPNSRDSTSESRNYREFGGLINGKGIEAGHQEEVETGEGGGSAALPLIMLTRSKSEPARTGERLNPEIQEKVRFCL